MKRYYTTRDGNGGGVSYQKGPAAEWRDLYRTLSALTGARIPASEPVQSAVDRWLALSIRAYTGDPKRADRLADGLGRSRAVAGQG